MKKFILITGMGHSGTRHPFSVLQRHPQVFAPEKKLNGVKALDIVGYIQSN